MVWFFEAEHKMGQRDRQIDSRLRDYIIKRRREAEEGCANAYYDLGLLYSTGQGVEQNLVAAHKWFNLAAMRGLKRANVDRAEVAREMNFQQIAMAQREARHWSKTHQ